MRIPLVTILLLATSPAIGQSLGARTQSPEAMAAGMRDQSPEQEIARLAAAAEAYPLGTPENPVRVGGPEGEHAYLGHLRCVDGSQPRIGARSDAGVGAYGSVVGAYEVNCGAVASRIVFDLYHAEHAETRAPAGFRYQP